jgi:protein-S-isoprenylcysteine O-methyltransferase Ste14
MRSRCLFVAIFTCGIMYIMSDNNTRHNHNLCHYSAHLPGAILGSSFLGLILHMWKPILLVNGDMFSMIGTFLLIVSPLLVMWSQKKRRDVYGPKAPELSLKDLSRGPYAYSRHPSHVGLFMLVIGFALILNSFFMIASIFIMFCIFHFFVVPKEEALLEMHIGETYRNYKKRVRMWI